MDFVPSFISHTARSYAVDVVQAAVTEELVAVTAAVQTQRPAEAARKVTGTSLVHTPVKRCTHGVEACICCPPEYPPPDVWLHCCITCHNTQHGGHVGVDHATALAHATYVYWYTVNSHLQQDSMHGGGVCMEGSG